MKMTQKLVVKLTDEEKNTLRKADEILTEIIDALIENKENGCSPWQDGLIAPDCFWSIRHHINQIDNEKLIP